MNVELAKLQLRENHQGRISLACEEKFVLVNPKSC